MDLPITERQFAALARISGMSAKSKAHQAMKLVFVSGLIPAEAARQTGLSNGYISNAKHKMIGVYRSLPQRIALLNEALGK